MTNNELINEITKYAQGMNCQADVFEWISKHFATQLDKAKIEQIEIEHIIDYLASDKRPKRLSKMSYEQAKNNTDKWNKALIKKGSGIKEINSDVELLKDFGDGFRIVKLVGKSAYEREGFLMRHCVSSYFGSGKEIHSLRDKDNTPHATLEKDQQIKGKGNGPISPKYIGYIVEYLKEIGMTVGDSEMKNLGYINVDKIKDKLHATKNNFFNTKYLFKQDKWLNKEGEEYCELDIWDFKELVTATTITNNIKIEINFNIADFLSKAISLLNKVTCLVKDISSGDYAQIGSSGYSAQIGSSGNYAKIGSSGNYAQIDVSGKKSIAAAVGLESVGKAAENGCLALAWFDKKNDRPRLSVGYVGENINANTWYKVDSEGNFIEVNNE